MGASNNLAWIAKGMKRSLYLAVAGLVFSMIGFADTMTLVGVQGGSMAGVYTSPYIGQITTQFGTQTSYVICDDFTTDASLNSPFTVTETLVSALTGTSPVKFDNASPTPPDQTVNGIYANQQQDYAVAAYLATEIVQEANLANPDETMLAYYSFALWDVFDPTLLAPPNGTQSCTLAFGCLDSTQLQGSLQQLGIAEQNAGSYLQYSNVTIYTPSPLAASQEFLVVSGVPEPPAIYALSAGLFGLMAIAFRKRTAAQVPNR